LIRNGLMNQGNLMGMMFGWEVVVNDQPLFVEHALLALVVDKRGIPWFLTGSSQAEFTSPCPVQKVFTSEDPTHMLRTNAYDSVLEVIHA
jgi:hypothetical protein